MQILFIVSVLDLFHTHMNRFKDEKNTKEHWGKKKNKLVTYCSDTPDIYSDAQMNSVLSPEI